MNKVEKFMETWKAWEETYKGEEESDRFWMETAKVVAFEMHKGVKDKVGQPYFNHPASIVKVLDNLEYPFSTQAVAYLHDVIEDIPEATLGFLREIGFPENIVNSVDSITRRDGESYFQYIIRVSKNPMAKDVKLFDLKHNTSLDRVLYDPSTMEKDIYRLTKYAISYQFLSGKIDKKGLEKRLEEIYHFLLDGV